MSLYIGWNPSEGATIDFQAPNAAKAGAYETLMELIISVWQSKMEANVYKHNTGLASFNSIKLLPCSVEVGVDESYRIQIEAASGGLPTGHVYGLKVQALWHSKPIGPEIALEMNHLINLPITKIIQL